MGPVTSQGHPERSWTEVLSALTTSLELDLHDDDGHGDPVPFAPHRAEQPAERRKAITRITEQLIQLAHSDGPNDL